jgi:hypothetical protein
MNKDVEKDYIKVPIYIEKAVKKLFKLKNQEKEIVSQVKDYMEHHDIPTETPLSLLKFFPEEEINPNQMSLFETDGDK